jgi:hypothetical protein
VHKKHAQAAQMTVIGFHLKDHDGFCGSFFASSMIPYSLKLKAPLAAICEEGRKSDQIM